MHTYFLPLAGRKTGRRSFYSTAPEKPQRGRFQGCKGRSPVQYQPPKESAKVQTCHGYIRHASPVCAGRVYSVCIHIYFYFVGGRGCVPAKDTPRPVCFICYFFAPFAVSPSPSRASRASARFSPPFVAFATLFATFRYSPSPCV